MPCVVKAFTFNKMLYLLTKEYFINYTYFKDFCGRIKMPKNNIRSVTWSVKKLY